MYAWELCRMAKEDWMDLKLDTRLKLAASLHLGWRYATSTQASFPYGGGALPKKLVNPNALVTNCTTFTTALLMAAFPDVPWTGIEYGDLQIFEDRLPSRPYSPMEAVERMKIGRKVSMPIDECWHLVQGWRQIPKGHAFFIYPEVDGTIRTLQASSVSATGPCWTTTSFEKMKTTYPGGLGLAQLFEHP